MSRLDRATSALHSDGLVYSAVGALAAAACLAAVALPRAGHAQASFTGLGDLPGGGVSSVAHGVSTDGSVVVGQSSSASGNEAFRWTPAGEMVGLGDLPDGAFLSIARDVSADGSVVVGQGRSGVINEAFRWTEAGGMVGLGDLPGGGISSDAQGVSGDGSVVVGQSSSASGNEAFRWSEAGGMVGLGDLPGGGFSSFAHEVSTDGLVVVGWGNWGAGAVAHGFRWTAPGGMERLGCNPFRDAVCTASDVSADGSVIVGWGTNFIGVPISFRWTAETGTDTFGYPPCCLVSGQAFGVSPDGSVVVGASQGEAYIWDAENDIRNLQDVLEQAGADLDGWVLLSANAISGNGFRLAIVGAGTNPSGQPEAWLATLPEPNLAECEDGLDNDGDGQVDLDDPHCPFPEATPEAPECDDGIDNDGDGLVDLDDPACQSGWPYWEAAPTCGIGFELVGVIVLALWGHGKRTRPRV
jgi:probable HAF family extracellular repeat protein